MVQDEVQKIKQTILQQTSNIILPNFNENGSQRDKIQIQHSMHWTDSLTDQTFCWTENEGQWRAQTAPRSQTTATAWNWYSKNFFFERTVKKWFFRFCRIRLNFWVAFYLLRTAFLSTFYLRAAKSLCVPRSCGPFFDLSLSMCFFTRVAFYGRFMISTYILHRKLLS